MLVVHPLAHDGALLAHRYFENDKEMFGMWAADFESLCDRRWC